MDRWSATGWVETFRLVREFGFAVVGLIFPELRPGSGKWVVWGCWTCSRGGGACACGFNGRFYGIWPAIHPIFGLAECAMWWPVLIFLPTVATRPGFWFMSVSGCCNTAPVHPSWDESATNALLPDGMHGRDRDAFAVVIGIADGECRE